MDASSGYPIIGSQTPLQQSQANNFPDASFGPRATLLTSWRTLARKSTHRVRTRQRRYVHDCSATSETNDLCGSNSRGRTVGGPLVWTKPDCVRGILQREASALPKAPSCRTSRPEDARRRDRRQTSCSGSVRNSFRPSPWARVNATSVDSVSVSYTWCGPALPSLIHIHFFHRPRNTALRFSTKASRPSRPSLVSNNPVWLARSRSSASSR